MKSEEVKEYCYNASENVSYRFADVSKVMKRLVVIFTILIIFSACSQNQKVLIYNTSQTQIINVNKKQDLDNLIFNFCDTLSVEIIGLYPILDILPNLLEESIIVKSLLIKNGFTQTDWGSGNWMEGPRCFYLKYQKDSCICEIFKKYYSHEQQKDGMYNLRVTERIICSLNIYMDE